MGNPFVHVELHSPDPQKAREFYSKLFQWSFEEMGDAVTPDHAYTLVKVGKGTGGGMMKQLPHGPSGWLPYAEVEDIHASTQKARELGAEVMKDVTEVPEMGWFSVIRDPDGALIGLWQSKM